MSYCFRSVWNTVLYNTALAENAFLSYISNIDIISEIYPDESESNRSEMESNQEVVNQKIWKMLKVLHGSMDADKEPLGSPQKIGRNTDRCTRSFTLIIIIIIIIRDELKELSYIYCTQSDVQSSQWESVIREVCVILNNIHNPPHLLSSAISAEMFSELSQQSRHQLRSPRPSRSVPHTHNQILTSGNITWRNNRTASEASACWDFTL